MTKVIFFIPNGMGGAEKISSIYAKILHSVDYDVKVVIIKRNNDNRKNITTFLPNSVKVEFIYCRKGYLSLLKIFKVLRKENPNYVFSSLTIISTYLILYSIFVKSVKVIARQCFTPGYTPDVSFKLNELLITLLFRFATINIAQTEEMKLQMIEKYKLPYSKVICINNPIDTEDIDEKIKNVVPLSGFKYDFISVGRISRQKDQLTLLKAFKEILSYNGSAKLTIVGSQNSEKDYYNEVIQYINENNMNSSIVMIDYTNNPFALIKNSDCFVLSSVSEGLPNVLIEAMYLNIPIVATNCIPFISQQIKDGVNGYTVPVGDYVKLAEAMVAAQKLKGKIENINFNSKIREQIVNVFKTNS